MISVQAVRTNVWSTGYAAGTILGPAAAPVLCKILGLDTFSNYFVQLHPLKIRQFNRNMYLDTVSCPTLSGLPHASSAG